MFHVLHMVATGQGKVREKNNFFKVREFQNLSGKFENLKIVRENGVLSEKNEHIQYYCAKFMFISSE